jgi:hypothetical protein
MGDTQVWASTCLNFDKNVTANRKDIQNLNTTINQANGYRHISTHIDIYTAQLVPNSSLKIRHTEA